MVHLKGVGTTIIHCHTHGHDVDLVQFGDGSVGIQVAGGILAIWEPGELEDAFCCYWTLTGMGRPRPAGAEPNQIIFLHRAEASAASMN